MIHDDESEVAWGDLSHCLMTMRHLSDEPPGEGEGEGAHTHTRHTHTHTHTHLPMMTYIMRVE